MTRIVHFFFSIRKGQAAFLLKSSPLPPDQDLASQCQAGALRTGRALGTGTHSPAEPTPDSREPGPGFPNLIL